MDFIKNKLRKMDLNNYSKEREIKTLINREKNWDSLKTNFLNEKVYRPKKIEMLFRKNNESNPRRNKDSLISIINYLLSSNQFHVLEKCLGDKHSYNICGLIYYYVKNNNIKKLESCKNVSVIKRIMRNYCICLFENMVLTQSIIDFFKNDIGSIDIFLKQLDLQLSVSDGSYNSDENIIFLLRVAASTIGQISLSTNIFLNACIGFIDKYINNLKIVQIIIKLLLCYFTRDSLKTILDKYAYEDNCFIVKKILEYYYNKKTDPPDPFEFAFFKSRFRQETNYVEEKQNISKNMAIVYINFFGENIRHDIYTYFIGNNDLCHELIINNENNNIKSINIINCKKTCCSDVSYGHSNLNIFYEKYSSFIALRYVGINEKLTVIFPVKELIYIISNYVQVG